MRVKVKYPGFYNGHRREGQVFDFPAATVKELPRWVVPLDPPPEVPAALTEPTALSAALVALNPEDDAHWTKAGPKSPAGLPDLKVLTEYVGAKVTRAMVEEAAPGFNRDAAKAVKRAAVDGGAGA